jgi:hypothetical protein
MQVSRARALSQAVTGQIRTLCGGLARLPEQIQSQQMWAAQRVNPHAKAEDWASEAELRL